MLTHTEHIDREHFADCRRTFTALFGERLHHEAAASIIGEMLQNVSRHAYPPAGGPVWGILLEAEGYSELSISDTGEGFDPATPEALSRRAGHVDFSSSIPGGNGLAMLALFVGCENLFVQSGPQGTCITIRCHYN